MDKWEKFFIIALNTKGRKGYNLTDGGEGMSGWICTDETRTKLSAKRKGVKKSPEHCWNIALSQRITSPFKNLQDEMEIRQIKYFELAELLGLSHPNFSNKMAGRCHFTDKDKAKLAEIFELSGEYLLTRDDGLSATTSYTEGYAKVSVIKRSYSPFKNLVSELDKRQITYRGLSKLTGISKSALPLKMSGKVNFTADEIAKLVEIFGKSSEYLLIRDDCFPIVLSCYHETRYKNLLNEINSRKLSYTKLAELLKWSRTIFSRKMLGEQNFTERDKAKLAEFFGKTIEYLMFKEEF